jgi:hypothetical protein
VSTVADPLYRLDIDSLKIQEEEVLTFLSGSENNSISTIKLTFPMHTAYCLDLQRTNKSQEIRIKRKGISPTHYSIQHIEGFELLCYKDKKQNLHSSIIETNSREYCPGTMNIYFILNRLELKRLSGIP